MNYNHTDTDSKCESQLCTNCQQFYGTKDTGFLCSSWFKQAKNKKSQVLKSEIRSSEIFNNNDGDLAQNLIGGDSVNQAFEIGKGFGLVKKTQESCCEEAKKQPADVETAVEHTNNDDKAIGEKTVHRKKNRCHFCNKKTGLLGIVCKWGFKFCSKHRHADDHDWQYDFKSGAKEQLEKSNPLVEFKKLDKIF